MIEQCVNSALQQSYQNVEVVVVDNASTDGTWEICRRLALHDTRVRIFQNDSNVGPVRNWRRCLIEARGEYAKFLFSDDFMAPRFLEILAPFLEDPRVGLVFCRAEIGDGIGSGSLTYGWAANSGKYKSDRFISDALFGGSVPNSPCAALSRLDDLRASLHEQLPNLPWGEFASHGAGSDLLLLLVTAQRYSRVGFVSSPLVFFRCHPGSITVQNTPHLGLAPYYSQARVWFCEQYRFRLFKPVLLRIWLASMKHMRCWLPFSSFPIKYGHCSFPLGCVDLVKCLVYTLRAKLFRPKRLVATLQN